MLKKNTTKTVVVENTFTVTGGETNQMAVSALVRKVNDEAPLLSLTLNVPGRKRGGSLRLDPDQVKDFAALFAAIVEDTQS